VTSIPIPTRTEMIYRGSKAIPVVVPVPPGDPSFPLKVRFWDFAATEQQLKGDQPDRTASCLMVRIGNHYYVQDGTAEWIAAGDLETRVYEQAMLDGYDVAVRWEIEPGSAGKMVAAQLMARLAEFDAQGIRPRGDKMTRLKPFAQQARQGNVSVVTASWNEEWLTELHHFPDMKLKDACDAASGAYYVVASGDPVAIGPSVYDGPASRAEQEDDDDAFRESAFGKWVGA
jgi:predicted phage terminase large subunit-like protein